MQPPDPRGGLALADIARLALARGLRSAGSLAGDRRPEDRRAYVGQPAKYFRDVLGITRLWSVQEEALDLIERHDRVLLPSGNNLGKTFLLGAYAVYWYDAVGAESDPEMGLTERGARVLLPGPSHRTILNTIYAEILEHMARAEARGHKMPGRRSQLSVLCRVRERWCMEPISPRTRTQQDVTHDASGRHAFYQIALIEEGAGVSDAVWRSVEGMCSSAGNKIISSFNPTEPRGPAFQRAKLAGWKVIHFDAFTHPNIRQRRGVIPSAIDHRVIDQRVVDDCTDLGPPRVGLVPDPQLHDFWYAVPPDGVSDDGGGRADGVPGHPRGEVRLYRPSNTFLAQVRGQWPASAHSGLFDPGAWDAAVRRGEETPMPGGPPERVGFDVAREGDDTSVLAPAWGRPAAVLLRDRHDALVARDEAALARLQADGRARVGWPVPLAKGRGPATARQASSSYPDASVLWIIDEGSVGASPLDHMGEVLGREVVPVSFAASPPDERLPGEPYAANMRASLFIRAAMLVNAGLVDLPDDPDLREECLAHEVIHEARTVVDDNGQRHRVEAVRVEPKDKVKKKLGRSPDRADALVLSLFEPPGGGWGLT
jgi:hypothetical protein